MSLDLEAQYATYLCAVQYVEPALMNYGWYIGAQGATVVRVLEDHLADTQSAATVRDIVYVFYTMQRQDSYDVANDADLLHRIDMAIDRIDNSTALKEARAWRTGIVAKKPTAPSARETVLETLN